VNGDRWKVLTEPNREKQLERDKAKLAREIEEIQKTCPFKPQLTKPSKTNRTLVNSRSHTQLRESFMSVSTN
jgi:protein subunit release factor B